ncbi:hypothetical protein B0H12DRAFT_1067080 [Mycena haematopus]|nr:hypothetical protein B0H12DRAFT_1067080 [Mycena haematopus]
MTARRRSFHLNVNAGAAIAHPLRPATLNLDPQDIQAQAGALTVGLLALARQASAFAFTLLGGCAPGVRTKTKCASKALLAGSPPDTAKMLLEGESIETTTVEGLEHPRDEEQPEVAVSNDEGLQAQAMNDSGIQLEELDIADAGTGWVNLDIQPHENDHLVEDPDLTPTTKTEKPALNLQVPPIPSIVAPPIAIGLGLLIPSASTNELRLLSPLESRYASPKPEFESVPAFSRCSSGSPQAELRANLVSKVTAFTAARLSGSRRSSSPPSRAASRPACLDDPFADLSTPTTLPSSFVPAHPAHFCYPSLQFGPDQPQSPTPHPRPGRPSLRQRTVFFAQVSPRANTPPPEFWSPHPAGSRSCAIKIKAPPSLSKRPAVGNKENQMEKTVMKIGGISAMVTKEGED